jgi:hypothetical protein
MELAVYLATVFTATPTPTPTVETAQGMSETLKLILTAAISVAVTLITGLIVAWFSRRGEHAKWVRQERLDAYLGMLRVINTISNHLTDARHDLEAGKPAQLNREVMQKDFPAVYAAIDLLGPTHMSKLAHAVNLSIVECGIDAPTDEQRAKTDAAEKAYFEAARKVLGIKNK